MLSMGPTGRGVGGLLFWTCYAKAFEDLVRVLLPCGVEVLALSAAVAAGSNRLRIQMQCIQLANEAMV